MGDSQEPSLLRLTLPKDLFRLRTEREEGKAIPSFFWGGRGGRKDFREERLGSGCDRRVSIPQEGVMGAVQEEEGGKRLKWNCTEDGTLLPRWQVGVRVIDSR